MQIKKALACYFKNAKFLNIYILNKRLIKTKLKDRVAQVSHLVQAN
jgi:hypothetical protein